jgi:siroheme synthase
MAMHRLAEIADALVRGGLPAATPTAVIAAATLAEERIVISTLDRVAADVRKERIEPPAIVVIGEIVSARDQLLGVVDPAADSSS